MGMVVKLDLDKAYDKPEALVLGIPGLCLGSERVWCLLESCYGCLSSAHFSLICPLYPQRLFPCLTRPSTRGSSLLFPLYLGFGSSQPNHHHKTESKGLFKGFQVGSNKVNVSHLQFADNTLILLDEEHNYGHILKSLIQCFELVSGLKVNWTKAICWGWLLSSRSVCKWLIYWVSYLG